MAFIHEVLQEPSYGWKNADGELSKPTPKQIFSEFFSRLNIFKDKKNWLSFMSWGMVFCLAPFLFLFIFKYFSINRLNYSFCVQHDSDGYAWYYLVSPLLYPWRL
jgi:hypothetical protein